jgi:drug/metabolite transporter (DMT)-like permease
MKLLDHQHLKGSLLFVLNRVLLLFSCLLFFGASYIANYHATVNEAWKRWEYIIYIAFILMFFSLRAEAEKILSKTGYKIVFYLLMNFFIDEYLGYDTWTWNDYLTVIGIGIEAVVHALGKGKKMSPNI